MNREETKDVWSLNIKALKERGGRPDRGSCPLYVRMSVPNHNSGTRWTRRIGGGGRPRRDLRRLTGRTRWSPVGFDLAAFSAASREAEDDLGVRRAGTLRRSSQGDVDAADLHKDELIGRLAAGLHA